MFRLIIFFFITGFAFSENIPPGRPLSNSGPENWPLVVLKLSREPKLSDFLVLRGI